MNKHLLWLLFPIMTGCSIKKVADINDFEKKKTFIKIIGFIKTNQTDSLKKYYPYKFEDDSVGFNNTILNTKMIINNSNSSISVDSIFIIDSSFVLSEKQYFHDYYLRFYKDTIYSGGIKMDFYRNMNNCVSVIQAYNIVDIHSLVDSLNEISKKYEKE